VNEATSALNAENWDSFNLLILVSELEKEFKVSFKMDEVAAIKSVKDIMDLLTRRGIVL
jgi:acyl carrier protein